MSNYNGLLYVFDKDENLLIILDNQASDGDIFFNDEFKKSLNDEWSYKFDIDMSKLGNIALEYNKVGFFDRRGNFQLFMIQDLEDNISDTAIRTAYALHDFQVLNENIIENGKITGTASEVLAVALKGTTYSVGKVDTTEQQVKDITMITSLEAVYSIAETFGLEVYWRLELDSNNSKISKRYVDLVKRIGKDTNLSFNFGLNVTSIKRKINNNFFTALYGRGKQLKDGSYANFGDATWVKGDNPTNKPKGQIWVADEEAVKKYGLRKGIYSNQNISIPTTLLSRTWEKLQKVNKPKLNYEASVIELSSIVGYENLEINLGDRFNIRDSEYNINEEVRVISETESILDELNKSVELGDPVKALTDDFENEEDIYIPEDGQDGQDGKPGQDAIYANLTNDSHVVPCDENGNNGVYSGCETTIELYEGTSKLTTGVTYAYKTSNGVVGTGNSSGSYAVTNMTVDTGYVDLIATYNNIEYKQRFSISKSKNGKNSITINLTNENQTFPALSSGVIQNNIVTSTTVNAYKGTKKVTATIGNILPVNGLSFSIQGETLTIVALSGSDLADSGEFDIPIIVEGVTYTKTFTYSKVKNGSDGADGDVGDFPDSLPDVPVLSAEGYFATISITWTFENKMYYDYELYASDVKGFTPTSNDLIFEGKASAFLHEVKPMERWYYKVRAKNSHGRYTAFSSEVYAETMKITDGTKYFESAAIKDALIEELRLDRGWIGTLRGHYIDARNLSVTDGNGKRTLDIDSFGNVNLDVTTLKISSSDVATKNYVNTSTSDQLKNYYTKKETDTNIQVNLNSITSKVESVENNQTIIDGKVSNLETWKKSAEQKITDSAIVNTVKAAKDTNGKNTFAQQSDITQLNDSWTAKFNDGYNQGITTINKNGIIVTSSNVKSKTSMSASGFKITKTDTNEEVFKVNSDGTLSLKGNMTVVGGSINIANKFKVDAYGRGTFEEQVFCQNLYAGYLRCYDGLQIKTTNNAWSTIAKYDDSAGRIRFGYGAYADGRNVWYDGGDYVKVRAKERLELTCKSWDAESDTKYSAQLQYYFGSDGSPVITFRPAMNNNMLLGSSSNRWKRIYSTEALNVASDRNAKENISYINPLYQKATTSDITLDDLYSFVKNELYIAKYNYKNSSKDTIGFIAQDLLEVDVNNSKAYDIANIVVNVDEEKNLSYDTGAYMNVLAGALKQAILKIEKLEGLINGRN